MKWNRSVEDSEDLTQSFFLQALEKDFFADYDSRKGRFRTFIRICLDRFLANQNKSIQAVKRGGKFSFLSLDFKPAEKELQLSSKEESPEQLFEREWIRNFWND